jgi:hypothetical protein
VPSEPVADSALGPGWTAGPGQPDASHAFLPAAGETIGWPVVNEGGSLGEDGEEEIDVAALAAYRTSINAGKPLSERKLAAMFGKTSRRWARNRMAEARQGLMPAIVNNR